MRLNLLSFNARGLNEQAAIDSLQLYIQDCRPALDIVMIQEHKYRGSALANLGKALWRQAKFWGQEALLGYGHNENELGAGCGGIATLLAPRWTSLVSATGTIHDNRVHWLILSGVPGGDIGIANIYAPNSSLDRCHLWEDMTRELPGHSRWILTGDFNMFESRSDKNRPSASMVPMRERELFDVMKRILRVEDTPRTPGSLKFSWDNGRQQGTRALARLDKVYTFTSTSTSSGRIILRHEIRGDMP